MRKHHSPERFIFKCSICDDLVANTETLRQHVRYNHEHFDSVDYKCLIDGEINQIHSTKSNFEQNTNKTADKERVSDDPSCNKTQKDTSIDEQVKVIDRYVNRCSITKVVDSKDVESSPPRKRRFPRSTYQNQNSENNSEIDVDTVENSVENETSLAHAEKLNFTTDVEKLEDQISPDNENSSSPTNAAVDTPSMPEKTLSPPITNKQILTPRERKPTPKSDYKICDQPIIKSLLKAREEADSNQVCPFEACRFQISGPQPKDLKEVEMKAHVSLHSVTSKIYRCDFCDGLYLDFNSLVFHHGSNHPRQQLLECPREMCTFTTACFQELLSVKAYL